MNNDTNNNLNGTVLGSVDNTNNTMAIGEQVESLDTESSLVMGESQVMGSSSQPEGVSQTQSTFFNNPPTNNGSVSSSNVLESPQPVPASTIIEPVSQTEPTPAYTNPQSINPQPMPGFENSGTIGTTPPISLEPEKKPKKKANKTLFVIIILILLAGVGFGTYYVLNYTDLLKPSEQISIVTKDLEISMGDKLSTVITDYADITGTDSRNCSLNTVAVDSSKEGTYEYKVTCGETVKTGKITIVDNTELVVETQTVYKTSTDTLEASEFAKVKNDDLTYEFVNQTEVDNALNGAYGKYSIKIKVTSKNNKTTEITGELVIMQYPIKGYLTCKSKEQNITESNAVMTVAERLAIVNDGNNGYGNIAFEIHTFKYSDETEYTNLVATYKKDNKITINNISGKTEFDDQNLTITITNELNNDDVVSEYGASNLQKYSTIKSYFEGTLGYTCSYDIKK